MSLVICPNCGNKLQQTFGQASRCPACSPAPAATWAAGSAFVVGLDLGQAQDYSALCALEVSTAADPATPGRLLRSLAGRHLERFPLRTSYLAIGSRIAELMSNPPLRGAPLVVDQTGVGRAVVDILRGLALPCRLVPVTITGGSAVTEAEDGSWHVPKKELVSVLQVLLQARRLAFARALPLAAALERELGTFTARITAAANETFGSWRERDHDDLVLAVALAAWHADRYPAIVWQPSVDAGRDNRSVFAEAPPGVFLDGMEQ
jgi:hypothetical protein